MTTPGTGGLTRLVGDAGAFLATCFGVDRHRWQGSGFDDVLSLADVDEILTGSGLRRPAIRLVREGDVIDAASWTRRARTGSVWIDDLVHPGKVLDHFADGATVVLQSLHRWWSPLTRLCRALEADLGHAVQANAYLTPPGAVGFDPHHDTHDVFVLQVSGAKDWVLREPLVDAPLARHRSDHEAAARQPILDELRLGPGDCLYLPRGHIHSAETRTGASLHITIGVLATTAHDLLRRLVDAAAEDPRFRRNLPAGFGTDVTVAAEAVDQLLADWSSWVSEVDPFAVAVEVAERFTDRRQPLLQGQLLVLATNDELGDDHVVRLRPGTWWRLEDDDDQVVLRTGDRRIALPAVLRPVLERLLDGTSTVVGDLGDVLDEGSRKVLVRRLVREGVLVTEAR